MRVLIVLGTRPEAIKMAPLIKVMRGESAIDARVCLTAQHRQMVDPILETFRIRPDYDFDIMRDGLSLSALAGSMMMRIEPVLTEYQPDLVLVQGDTATTVAASLAAHYQQIDIGHIEAGLRTGNLSSPWPEEANRRLTTVLAKYHFAPTPNARANLLREGVSESNVYVTGNTVIDALLDSVASLRQDAAVRRRLEDRFGFLNPKKRLILVTGHRRENLGPGLEAVCLALAELSKRRDVEIVYPVHLNPKVNGPVRSILENVPGIFLMEPQDYLPFVYLMDRASLLITDSGGIQEEAPALGKPVLVTRDTTERPEAIAAGTARLVGTDRATIVMEANRLLDDPDYYAAMARAANPYGDGKAAQRIRDILMHSC